jgi:integrase
VAQIKSLFGETAVGDFKGEDLFEYRDAVALLPRNQNQEEHGQDFAELVHRLNQTRDPRPRICKTTVQKQIRYIQTLIAYAYSERWISQNDVRCIAEARAVFAQPFFTRDWASESTRGEVRDSTIRWLMMLGFLTGARLEELGQIQVTDIKRERDIVFIAIDDLGSDGTQSNAKSLKTESSHRRVPLHPRAIDPGFLRFVDTARRGGKDRLFDDLRRDRYARYTQVASQCCNRLLDHVTRDRNLVFHSFRHLYKDLCRNAGFPECVSDQLTGHAPAPVSSGSITLSPSPRMSAA